jgi:hypothetical protein
MRQIALLASSTTSNPSTGFSLAGEQKAHRRSAVHIRPLITVDTVLFPLKLVS